MSKKKYIDLNQLLDGFAEIKDEIATGDEKYDKGFEDCVYETEMMLNRLRPADVEKVRHEKWINHSGGEWGCSSCANIVFTEGSWETPYDNYCPYCGAKMDKEQEW